MTDRFDIAKKAFYKAVEKGTRLDIKAAVKNMRAQSSQAPMVEARTNGVLSEGLLVAARLKRVAATKELAGHSNQKALQHTISLLSPKERKFVKGALSKK